LNAKLVPLGYHKKGQNIKALAKADGNIDMAIGILKEKLDKKNFKKQNKIQRTMEK
jgi:translation elongation factor EF-Ts